MSEWPRWLRWLVVSFGGALLAAAVFVNMSWSQAQQHPNDAAYGSPRIFVFLDPFVITLAGGVALVSGLVAFVLALLFLDRTEMWKTAALTYSAVILELVLVGSYDLQRSLFWAYPTLIAAAIVSRLAFTRTASPAH